MKKTLLVLVIVLAGAGACLAQVSGNVAYSQSGGKARAEQNERSKRTPAPGEAPPTATTMFVDAGVLINVKADEYVATFGVSQEGATVAECHEKMDAAISAFTGELKRLGVAAADVFVDFAAQNKIYGYEGADTVAREKLAGFELKKNVSIHYRDKALLDKLVVAASRSQIFDLIKVDYIARDTAPIHERLREEAARIIKGKAQRYERLLGARLLPPAQIYAEKPSIYFPTEMYDSGARKGRTFFFNPLDADGFDAVINPVVIEPVVQFTLYLKVKYEIEPAKDKK